MAKEKSSYPYMVEDSEIGRQFGDLYKGIEATSVLDGKTFQFVYIAYLAARGILSGVRKHVTEAKTLGATRAEIQAVLLAGLPVGGATLADAYKVAMECFDRE